MEGIVNETKIDENTWGQSIGSDNKSWGFFLFTSGTIEYYHNNHYEPYGGNKHFHIYLQQDGLKKGDIVSIELNCDDGELTFYHNDKNKTNSSFKIPKLASYVPGVTVNPNTKISFVHDL